METLRRVLHYPFTKLELVHNNSHTFVGGDMRDSSVSPSDPVFWLLHTFYDMVWEYFLNENARFGEDITQLYPSDEIYPLNRSISLIPVTIKQALKLNILLSKYIYTFSPQPQCQLNNLGCTSQYLTCINKQCVPSFRECNEGPVTDNYCKYFKCKANWRVVPLDITLSFTNKKQLCETPCNNAFPINIYSSGFKQMTIYLNSTLSEVYVEAILEMFTSLHDIVVADSCLNQCDAYCLVNGKYERCYELTIPEEHEHNMFLNSSSKDNSRNITTENSIPSSNLLFICDGSRSSSRSSMTK